MNTLEIQNTKSILNHKNKNLNDVLFLWEEAKKKLQDFINYHSIPLNQITLSFSGGKDSTVLIQLIKEIQLEDKINIVYSNTKMEFETINEFIQSFDNVQIIEPQTALPIIYLKHGLPIHSKHTSEMLSRLQKHNFDFVNDTFKSFEELIIKYPKCKSALKFLTGSNSKLNCPNWLKRQLKDIEFKVSNKCCEELKKKPLKLYNKQNNIKMNLIGIRKAEGGIRSAQYKSCIVYGDVHKYFPLFHFTDEDIDTIIEIKNIKISDAYTKYGMKRTGCVACPFSKNWKEELEILKKYEPKKYEYAIKTYSRIYEIYEKR